MRVRRRDALKLGLTGLVCAECSRSPSPRLAESGPLAADVGSGAALPVGPVTVEVSPPTGTFTLAFGACSKPNLPQPLWTDIRAVAPDAWAWLGDNVYADTEDISRTRSLYRMQSERADYAALVAQTEVVGIWDDHDLGRNDVGSEYPAKKESQAALLDFLGEPADSPRRGRLGVYASYDFGSGEQRVKLILLDARYHRDRPSARGDTLGEAQWTWLERELTTSTARVHLVASGYQVLPLDHSNEKWGNFPAARTRLLDLFARTKTPGLVLLSGDRHFSELSRFEGGPLEYPLHELTSSGLTHSYDPGDEPNRFRMGSLYPHRNFGTVRIDWANDELALEARGKGGTVALGTKVRLSTLTT
jgi:alkaline phosphatase D